MSESDVIANLSRMIEDWAARKGFWQVEGTDAEFSRQVRFTDGDDDYVIVMMVGNGIAT